MAKKDIWMPLNIGDYLADTMSLTAEQHGVYLLLLMDYWKSGPLADDDRQLCATGKVTPKAWKAEIGPIIRRFFHKGDDGLLHQKRADAEITKTGRISEVRRSAAIERHNRGKEPDAEPLQTACKTDANASQRTDQTASKQGDIARVHALAPPLPSEKKESPPTPLRGADDEFREFWAVFPRKIEGPGACRKAWDKARKTAAFPDIMAGLRRYPFKPDFLPMAATWLNQQRWLTEADTASPSGDLLDPYAGSPMTGGF